MIDVQQIEAEVKQEKAVNLIKDLLRTKNIVLDDIEHNKKMLKEIDSEIALAAEYKFSEMKRDLRSMPMMSRNI